jgi:hypothetical protein
LRRTINPTVEIAIVAGVEGNALVVNGTRVAGPKPWGGGRVILKWDVDEVRLREALPICKSVEVGSDDCKAEERKETHD